MISLPGLKEKLENLELSLNDRALILDELAENYPQDALKIIVPYTKDKHQYMRSASASSLGKLKGRKIYPYLLELMYDNEIHVRKDTAIALGNTKDSRALFPLINFYNSRDYQEKHSVLLTLKELEDPRSLSFLVQVLETENDKSLKDEALYVKNMLEHSQQLFIYTYNGAEEKVEAAKSTNEQILIGSIDDLESSYSQILKYSNAFDPPRPQTYILTLNGEFVIGGLIQEHVEVSKGEDVLSAGEIEFKKDNNIWAVDSINNRSNGYYPDPSSFIYVKTALKNSGIVVPQNSFTETFPKNGFNDSDFLSIHPQFK